MPIIEKPFNLSKLIQQIESVIVAGVGKSNFPKKMDDLILKFLDKG